jgi:hypothetical protein
MQKVITKTPFLNRDLIKFLEEQYPDTLPRGKVNERDLAFMQGQRDVVDFLKQTFEQED